MRASHSPLLPMWVPLSIAVLLGCSAAQVTRANPTVAAPATAPVAAIPAATAPMVVANALASSRAFGEAVRRCTATGDCAALDRVTAPAPGSQTTVARIETDLHVPAPGGAPSETESRARSQTDFAEVGESLESLSLSTLSPDVLLQGVANFLLGRLRAEARDVVIGRLQREACVTSPYSSLLTNACGFLGEHGADDPFRADFGIGLRTALERDVVELPSHLLMLSTASLPSVELRAFLRVADLLLRRSSPAELAENLRQELSDPADAPAAQALQFIALTAQQFAIQGNALDPAARDRAAYFLARTALCVDDACRGRLDTQLHVLHDVAARVSTMVAAVDVMNDAAQPARIRRERIAAFASNLSLAASAAIRLSFGVTGRSGNFPPASLRIVLAIERIVPFFDALASGEPGRVVAAVLGEVRRYNVTLCSGTGDEARRCRAIVRVVEFGAELASARTEQDVERILEGFALPPGAYRLQRERRTFAISSVGGLAAGGAWSGRGNGGTATLMLTLGFDYTWPIGAGWDFGLHLSVIDLGAYVSTSGPGAPDTRWEHFITPGLYARFGLPDLPFVLGAGVNVSPIDEGRPVRLLALFGFDLPIFLLGE